MRRQIEMMSDLSERVHYNIEGLPIHAHLEALSEYAGMAWAAHWHDDIEFNIALKGRARFTVNGEPVDIEAGQGVFFNARQLHESSPIDGDCEYVCVLIHPSLLAVNDYLAQHEVQPILENGAFTHMVLQPDVPDQRQLIWTVCQMRQVMADREQPLGLTLQSLGYRACALLHRLMPDPSSASVLVDQRLAQLRLMVGHVQRHYADPLALRDIAAAGNTSRTACCALFQQHLHQTPIGYLMRYRLEKAAELLRNPNLTVTEVALSTGFSSPSYFTERFRKQLGQTPSEYRKQCAAFAAKSSKSWPL